MKTFIASLCISALLVMIHVITFGDMIKSVPTEVKNVTNKPIIYTFYGKIDTNIKHTGMTDEADERLLEVWKAKWTEAGWDAQILDLDDARKHPRFTEFDEKLQKIPLHGVNEYYNQLCYYRWLAMAAIGGGWMSDYDVLPMNINKYVEYYQDGNFTVYGGSAPCLMSGSQSEWERMSFSILDNGLQNLHAKLWSDMFAILDLFMKDAQVYRLHNFITPIVNNEWSAESCALFENKLAVHFSHSAWNKNNLGDINMRADFAKNWVEKWKSECGDIDISSYKPPAMNL